MDALQKIHNELRDAAEAMISGGTCASVSLQLKQTAVLTRDAFDAQLVLNSAANPLSDVGVDIIITDAHGNDVTRFFGIYPPTTSGFFATGSTPESCVGNLAAQSTGKTNWIFVPSTELARYGAEVYYVGGFLRYTENGKAISIPLAAVGITVLPQPELDLVYFWQRDVYGDDPWTEEIEPSIPFELVVMVINNGNGVAQQMRIESGQPTIVENEKGLLIDFAIIGSQVNGKDYSPSLTVNFGDIAPGEIAIGQWFMTSTLQGQFTDYQASFRHINGFNDLQFSLIKSIEIHELIRTVNANGDGKPDMLVNDSGNMYGIPDTLYMSDGNVVDVGYCPGGTLTGKIDSAIGFSMLVSAAMPSGWAYLRLIDTEIDSSMYRLYRIERSDGTEVELENFWQTDRTFGRGGQKATYEQNIHLLDFNSTGEYVFYFETIQDVPLSVDVLEQVPNRLTDVPVSSIDVQFNREIDLNSFTWKNLALTRGLSGNLLNQNVTIEQIGDALYRINGLSEFTKADGEYVLTLYASGINDPFGVMGTGVASSRWIKTTNSPIITAVENAPAPFGQSSHEAIDIHFSLPISDGSFDLSDLILTRGDSENLINDSVIITKISPTHWRISGLTTLTTQDSQYELVINVTGVTGTDITKGIGQEIIAWVKDTIGPSIVEWSGLTREYTNFAYDTFYVEFTETIDAASFDFQDLVLTRDGITVPLDSRIKIVQATQQGNQWQIAGLGAFTGDDGVYTLTINMAGLRDESGNTGTGTVPISWTMDTMVPDFVTKSSASSAGPFRFTPFAETSNIPVYEVTENLVFYSDSTTFRLVGSLSKENLTVQIYNKSTGIEIVAFTLIDTATFDYTIELREEGVHELLIRVNDRAGNWEEFDRTVYIDLTPPFVLDVQCFQDDAVRLEIGFSESTNLADLIANGLITDAVRLSVGGNVISVPLDHFTYSVRTMTLSVSLAGLLPAIPESGIKMELLIDGSMVQDKAGNLLRGSRSGVITAIPEFRAPVFFTADASNILANSYSVPMFVDWNNDGVPDLIVGEKSADGFGRVRVYLNSGTAEAPIYTTYTWAMCGDSPLTVDAGPCLGAYPRMVDWDADGMNDLIVGLADGRILVFLNVGTAEEPNFAEPFFVQVGTVNLDVGDRAAFEIVDWNNDGKFDLVAGGLDGRIRVYLNSGDTGSPVFASEMIIQLAGSDLAVDSGRASVAVADLDGDGQKDLIVGNTNGQILFYKNVGTDETPVFAAPMLLTSAGNIIDIDGSARSRPFVADINGDGILDLIVGAADGRVRVYYGEQTPVFSADGEPGTTFVFGWNISPSDVPTTSPVTGVLTTTLLINIFEFLMSKRHENTVFERKIIGEKIPKIDEKPCKVVFATKKKKTAEMKEKNSRGRTKNPALRRLLFRRHLVYFEVRFFRVPSGFLFTAARSNVFLGGQNPVNWCLPLLKKSIIIDCRTQPLAIRVPRACGVKSIFVNDTNRLKEKPYD